MLFNVALLLPHIHVLGYLQDLLNVVLLPGLFKVLDDGRRMLRDLVAQMVAVARRLLVLSTLLTLRVHRLNAVYVNSLQVVIIFQIVVIETVSLRMAFAKGGRLLFNLGD